MFEYKLLDMQCADLSGKLLHLLRQIFSIHSVAIRLKILAKTLRNLDKQNNKFSQGKIHTTEGMRHKLAPKMIDEVPSSPAHPC